VHRIVQGHFGQRQQKSALNPIIEGHGISLTNVTVGTDNVGDISCQPSDNIVKPEFAHLANAVGSQEGPAENDTLASKSWKLEFEEELFRSTVYSRTSDNSSSVSDLHSTIGTPAMSILSQLTLADVSIVSVLHLPVQLEALVNRSAYSDGLKLEIEPGHALSPGVQVNTKGLDQTQEWTDFFIRTNIPHPSHNYAQEIALALGVPMHATRDQFMTAALEFANIKRQKDTYSLYITDDTRAGVNEFPVEEGHRPLLLHSKLSLHGFSPSFALRQNHPKEAQAASSLHQKAQQPGNLTSYIRRYFTIFRSARSRGMRSNEKRRVDLALDRISEPSNADDTSPLGNSEIESIHAKSLEDNESSPSSQPSSQIAKYTFEPMPGNMILKKNYDVHSKYPPVCTWKHIE
jgi:hypothetical protein